MGNEKTSHKNSTHVNFCGVILGKLINYSTHQFDFVDTPYGPSKNDIIHEYHFTDNDGDTTIILTNLSNRYKVSPVDIRKVISNSNPSYTKGTKELIIYRKIYRQINIKFIYASTQKLTHCQSLVDQGDNGWVTGEDGTTINTCPHMNFNIRGIDNNEITSVTIYTIGNLDH